MNNRQGTNNKNGALVISEDVIAKIAGVAAKDVPGVAKLALLPADVRAFVRRDKDSKAVRVLAMDSAMTIEVAICMATGYKLSEVCFEVQKAVKSSVQNMVGRPVAKVNVIVVDIDTNSEN